MASSSVFARDSALFNPRLTFTNADGSAYALAGTQTVKIYKQDGTLLVTATAGSGMTVGSNYIDLAIPAATMTGLGAQFLTVQALRTDIGPIDQGSFTVRCLAIGEAAATDISGVVAIQFGVVLIQVTQINLSVGTTTIAGETLFRSTAIGGSANAVNITTNGLGVLSATPKFIFVIFASNNTTAVTGTFDGVVPIPIVSPLNAALKQDEIIAGVPYLLSVTSTQANIFESGATW